MLTESKLRWIRRLLAEGLSYRAIREMTGVSRGAIGRIARGERPDYEALGRAKQEKKEGLKRTPRPIRCPGCGYRVYPPCRICRVRKALADGKLREVFREVGLEEPLGLELRPEHQKRYEEVRARRRRRERKKRARRPRS